MIKSLESNLSDDEIIENGFEIVNIGDKVKFPVYKMTDIPDVGDRMQVGPLAGTCIASDGGTVTMEVEWNLYSTESINESNYRSGISESEFLDKYFSRVDLSNKARYKYYKYKGKEFAYDTKNSVVIRLFKDEDEIAEVGKANTPYREIDSVGLSYDNWKNKAARNEYLDEYIYDFDSYTADLADDFVKNELPYYQSESLTKDDIKKARSSSSFMNDRATLTVNGRDYVKIGNNKWQYNPSQAHALGGIYTDNEIFAIINNAGNGVNVELKEDEDSDIPVDDDLTINEYAISYQYTPNDSTSMVGELMIMATSNEEAEKEFYKYHDSDYTVLEVTRHDIDLNSPNTFDNSAEVIADMTVEASGNSADNIDPNQTGAVEPSGNDANIQLIKNDTTNDTNDTKEESISESCDKSEGECDMNKCVPDEDFRTDNNEDDSEILVELSEDGAEYPEWTYTEDEIFDVAYRLMNDGYCEGWEAADIQDELLYADHDTVGDAPYIFTMIEEDIDDEYELDEAKYPNGLDCDDNSPDMDTYLDYMYGTDRDMDNSHYTDSEKQRAIDYWFKKHDQSPYDESIELDESDCEDPADNEELVAQIDE